MELISEKDGSYSISSVMESLNKTLDYLKRISNWIPRKMANPPRNLIVFGRCIQPVTENNEEQESQSA